MAEWPPFKVSMGLFPPIIGESRGCRDPISSGPWNKCDGVCSMALIKTEVVLDEDHGGSETVH